jgi:hypothetical protein
VSPVSALIPRSIKNQAIEQLASIGRSQSPFGTVDISITVFDKYDHGNELVSRCCIESPFGWQFSDSSVAGIIEESFNSLKQNNTIL